ncbi:MAG: methionyl-tRNA formyltransferase [Ilumatobacteraceae bacterium]
MNALAPLPIGAATRIVYFGTPEVAVAPLRALHQAGVRIDLVVTRPDTRRGRGPITSPSPVKQAATQLGIPVSHDLASAATLANGDDVLGVVVAYGRLLPISLLSVMPMVNVHFSLLPRWRGAAPVERALLAGDRATGVCIMRVVETLDMGEVYRRVEMEIRADDTVNALRDRLCAGAIPLLIDVVTNGAGVGEPQVGEATYASKITAADLEFDWTKSAEQLERITRVGVGFTKFRGKRLNIRTVRASDTSVSGAPGQFLELASDGVVVTTGDGALCLLSVQPEGKPMLDALNWSRGARLELGELFG